MHRIVCRLFAVASIACMCAAWTGLAAAQDWPNRPVRAIVPFTVGSSLDIIGRVSLDPVSAALRQSIVVENRGGAGGTIGAALVARSEPDGYTLLVHASAHSAAPAAYPGIQYDVRKDFAAVAVFGVVPNVLIISPKKGIKTLKELVAYAKKGNLIYASAGVGSASHWAVERIKVAGGFTGTHVPYKGGPEGILDVSTGRVDIMSPGISSALQFIKEGRLIALAVSTQKRSATLPDVPTTQEAGLAGAEYNYWNGLLAPARTPRAIIERLHQEVLKAVAQPQVKEKFAQLAVEPLPISAAEFDAMISREIDENIALVKAAGLSFQ